MRYAHPHLSDHSMWCLFVPPGVLGALSPPGRQQGHAGLHHSSQRSVWHHRRSGHHHHVCLSRHSQRREWRVLRWPQVRAGNGPDCVWKYKYKTWLEPKSHPLVIFYLTLTQWHISLWPGAGNLLETTNYPQGLNDVEEVSHCLLFLFLDQRRGRIPMMLKDLEVRNYCSYIPWNPILLC